MPLMPGQPTATDRGLFPIPPGPGREQLRRKYRALGDAINRVWSATVNSDVALHREGFHIDTEQVSIDTADAVTVARTIDLSFCELLSPVARRLYEALRSSDPDGRVVRGLSLIRNSEVHRHAMIDMDTKGVISGFGDCEWRVHPQWKPYADLLTEVRTIGPKESRGPHDRYQDSVAGLLVVETLMDVLRFFDRCDPSLTRRGNDGDIARFPLREFIEHTYECRHPYALRVAEMNDLLLDRWMLMAPTGRMRQIRRAVPSGDTTLYVGLTDLGHHSELFVESADQIVWDLAGGYHYTAATRAGKVLDVAERDRVLISGEIPLTEVELVDAMNDQSAGFDGDTDEGIQKWWTCQTNDAFRYRSHRRAAG
ncbi:hypothetical protein ACWFPY_03890 [Nocardia fluminea]